MSANTAKQPARERRTQAERSRSMRKRLILATLEELAENGYAGLSLNAVVRRAGVSRGAQVHHFPNKNALILASARYLLRRAYRILGDVLLGISNEDERLDVLIEATWREVYATPMFNAFFELLIASQHDRELSQALRALGQQAIRDYRGPVEHYFEKRDPDSADTADLFLLLSMGLTGMGALRGLARDPEQEQEFLDMWIRLLHTQVRVRKSIDQPPARPESWDLD